MTYPSRMDAHSFSNCLSVLALAIARPVRRSPVRSDILATARPAHRKRLHAGIRYNDRSACRLPNKRHRIVTSKHV